MALTYSQSVADQQAQLNKQGAGLKVDGLLGPLTQAAITKYASAPPTTLTQGQSFTDPAGRTGIVNYDAQTGTRLARGATTTIPTATLGNQTTYKIPTAAPSNSADVAMAGATEASTQMTTEQKALATKATADQTSYDKLSGEISSLLGSATGQGAATLKAENAAGVPQMQQQLQGINSQITTKLAEFKVIQDKYAETIQAQEQRTIPMANIIGRTAEINRSLALQKNTFASDIGLLQAQAEGVQGNLELAKSTADRAVDLKYEDIKTQIQVKMQQLEMIRDSLTATERKQAAILDRQYQTAENNLAIQVANEKDKNTTILNLLQQYPGANITLSDTVEQAASKAAKYAEANGIVAGGLTPYQTLSYQNQIEDNMRVNPAIKNYNELVNFGVPSVIGELSSDPNSVKDTILMRTLAKITDPTTGVREGEYETFTTSIGALGRLMVLPASWLGEGRLTAEGRSQMLNMVLNRFNAAQKEYNTQYDYYNNQAAEGNVNLPPAYTTSQTTYTPNTPLPSSSNTTEISESEEPAKGFWGSIGNFLWGDD